MFKIDQKKIKNKKISLINYAYLKDRINVNRGRLQIYGTQFYLKNNKLVPRAIRDKKNLNKRRKKYGLETFAIYQKKMESRKK